MYTGLANQVEQHTTKNNSLEQVGVTGLSGVNRTHLCEWRDYHVFCVSEMWVETHKRTQLNYTIQPIWCRMFLTVFWISALEMISVHTTCERFRVRSVRVVGECFGVGPMNWYKTFISYYRIHCRMQEQHRRWCF